MKTALYCALVLGLVMGQAAAVAPVGNARSLLARAKASSKATAEDGATATAYSSAVAKGDVKAISDAVAEANKKGDASAISKALADGYKKGGKKQKDAIARALASALDLSEGDANKALEGGEGNIANAIANSRGGKTVAEATSVSEAVSKEKDATINAIVKAFSEVDGGGEALANAKVAAKAIGEATARAYASAQVFLSVEGEGDAAGEAKASAAAVATATATVIAEGVAEAANKYGKTGISVKKEVVSEAIAKASADAYVSGSQQGKGDVSVIQESVSEAVAKPVADVLFEVLAVAYEGDYETLVYVDAADASVVDTSKADTFSEVQTSDGGKGDAEGSADASAYQKCSGIISALCCRGRDKSKDRCGCRGFDTQNCRAWREEVENGITTVWKVQATQKQCAC